MCAGRVVLDLARPLAVTAISIWTHCQVLSLRPTAVLLGIGLETNFGKALSGHIVWVFPDENAAVRCDGRVAPPSARGAGRTQVQVTGRAASRTPGAAHEGSPGLATASGTASGSLLA